MTYGLDVASVVLLLLMTDVRCIPTKIEFCNVCASYPSTAFDILKKHLLVLFLLFYRPPIQWPVMSVLRSGGGLLDIRI